MIRRIMLAGLAMALVLPTASEAVVTIQVDSCVVVNVTQTRIYFTASNADSAYVGILSFQFNPQTPADQVVDSGSNWSPSSPWTASLGLGGEAWFGAPPFAPYYYLRTRGGFYITVEGIPGCYDAAYYNRMIQQVYGSVVCFTNCLTVPVETGTWGAVKALYQ